MLSWSLFTLGLLLSVPVQNSFHPSVFWLSLSLALSLSRSLALSLSYFYIYCSSSLLRLGHQCLLFQALSVSPLFGWLDASNLNILFQTCSDQSSPYSIPTLRLLLTVLLLPSIPFIQSDPDAFIDPSRSVKSSGFCKGLHASVLLP